MKAKAIAAKYIETVNTFEDKGIGQDQASAELIQTLWSDFKETIQVRNIKLNSSIMSVIDEMNRKANAVRSILFKKYELNLIKVDGFNYIIEHMSPETYEFYKRYLAEKGQ